MQAPTGSGPVERVLNGLTRRRETCVAEVVSEARMIDGYARLDADQAADVAENVRGGYDAILRAIAQQRPFTDDDVRFVWDHIRRRTEAGVPEGDMMAVVRIFQRRLWDLIVEFAGDDAEGRAAALVLARPLIGYVDVL